MAKLHALDKLTRDNGTRQPVQRAVQFCAGGLSVLDGEVLAIAPFDLVGDIEHRPRKGNHHACV